MEIIEYHSMLRHAIEASLGFELKTLSDFAHLEDRLVKQLNLRLSPTTLRRFWGYQEVEKATKVSNYTLDILSQFVGYTDYATFCESQDGSGESQSEQLIRNRLLSEELLADDRILVTWNPGRRLMIRYLGNSQFVVEESLSSKLHVGDTFLCHLFLEREPLYLSNLVHDGHKYPNYVCGRKDGILFHRQ